MQKKCFPTEDFFSGVNMGDHRTNRHEKIQLNRITGNGM